MRFVKTADARPHHCSVIPHIGGQHHAGFIDTGTEVTAIDPHIYVSLVALGEMCRVVGWPTPDEHQHLQATVNEQAARIGELEEQLTEANAEIDAVYVLRSKKWTPAKKPGRPKKEEAAA